MLGIFGDVFKHRPLIPEGRNSPGNRQKKEEERRKEEEEAAALCIIPNDQKSRESLKKNINFHST